MSAVPAPVEDDLQALAAEVADLRQAVLEEGGRLLADLGPADAAHPSLENLANYLALRRRDIRGLQRRLMAKGLSSLGRLESRVLPTLDAVQVSVDALSGRAPTAAMPSLDAFFAGEAALEAAADTLFGPPSQKRRGRIMVTLPGTAADDPAFVADLAARGMDIARINCAHDGPDAWAAMAGHVRVAGRRRAAGSRC